MDNVSLHSRRKSIGSEAFRYGMQRLLSAFIGVDVLERSGAIGRAAHHIDVVQHRRHVEIGFGTGEDMHLAPIAQEVDPAWLDCFPGALLGVTPQGWLRQWDAAGRVSPIGWAEAESVLPHADAVIISIEDIGHDESIVQEWAALAKVLVVTRGALGCTVYTNRQTIAVPTHAARLVDTTGAGDVFSASYFVRLRQTGDPAAAARFANCMAGHSVTRRGLAAIPIPSEIEECLAV